jgi:hypothetical protein
VTVYFVTRPIDSRSCLLSLLLSSRNLDIDLNQQALVQLSPPPLPKLNQIQLWVILQPELGLTCHTNPPPLPMPSHLMLFYDQPPPLSLAQALSENNSFESQSSSVNDSPGRSESIGLALRSERSAFPFEAGVDVLSS